MNHFLKKTLVWILVKTQGLPVYRKIASALCRGIVIKEADEKDVRRFHSRFNPRHRQLISSDPNVANFVAKRREEVIGFIQLVRRLEKDYPYTGYWLHSLAVRLLYRGMGIGEGLVQGVIEKAQGEGVKELSLLVRKDNYGAIRLYQKIGFKIKVIPALEERLKKEKLERIIMHKELMKTAVR